MASLKALALYSFFPIGLALVETFTQHRLTGAMNFVLYGIDDIFRVAGSFENPNDFVVLLLFSVPLLLLWSLQTKRWSLRLFLIAGCLLELLILMKTYSRSGYLSMAFTLLMIAVLGQGKIRRLGILLCFLGVCGLLGLQETRDRLVTLVGIRTSGPGVSQGLASVNYRRQLASIALNEFSKKPVLGVGFGNIGARAATYSPLLANKSTAENTYLEILAELGLVGFLAYLFFLGIAWSTLKTGLNRVRGDPNIEPFYVALAAGFCGFAFNNLFDTNFQDNLPWILLAILVHLGVSQACPIPLNETKGNDHPPDVRIPCQTLP
jgi:O-antigen ligase